MKSLDEYKDFSEHECLFCQGIDISMKIYQYGSAEYLEILYICLHCHKKRWVQHQLCGVEVNISTLWVQLLCK